MKTEKTDGEVVYTKTIYEKPKKKTDSQYYKEYKFKLSMNMDNKAYHSRGNRAKKRAKTRMCNKKHTVGRLAWNKDHKHLNNAI